MKYSENKMGVLMSLTLFFFLWKNLKIIKYTPALVGFISVLSIFILQRMTFGWENLWRTLLASRLTLVFFAFFKSKSVMN
ncbi:hypothetical protein [Bacillus toyonensis]|uniref:hypothetical protein n=1 Tax=Bacillus toyonensis TaxID=155322 RepID=UPI0028776C7B|nr:hypothetical protein [Bacillus toyonensis]